MLIHIRELGTTSLAVYLVAIAAAFWWLGSRFLAYRRRIALAKTKKKIEGLRDRARRAAHSDNEEVRRGVTMLVRLIELTARRDGYEISQFLRRELDRIIYAASPAYRLSSGIPINGFNDRLALPMRPLTPTKPVHELEIEEEVGMEDVPLEIETVLETPTYRPRDQDGHDMLELPDVSKDSQGIAQFIEETMELIRGESAYPAVSSPSDSGGDSSGRLVPVGLQTLAEWSVDQTLSDTDPPKK